MAGGHQIPLDFSGGTESGFEAWSQEQREIQAKVSQKLGLPLGARVEITLRCSQVLRGRLKIRNGILPHTKPRNVEMEVDGVSFLPGEIESCIRLEDS